MYFTQCFNFQHKNSHQLHPLYHVILMPSLVRMPIHFNFWVRFASCCWLGVRMWRLWLTYSFISHNAKFMFSAYIHIYIYFFLIFNFDFFFIYFGIICLTKSFIPNDVHSLVGNLQSFFLKNCTCHQLTKLGAQIWSIQTWIKE